MKLLLVIFAVIGLSCAVPAPKSLKSDLDEFVALIPKEKLVALYHKYENDPDIKKVVAYLKSEDFAKVAHIVASVAEVKDIVNYLEDNDVPAIELINKVADRLGLPHWGSYSQKLRAGSSRTWRDFINEAKQIIPINKIMDLAVDKLANSADFQALYLKIASVDYQHLHEAALSHPEIVDMINRLTNMGVDVHKVWETIKSIFGWE